MKDKYSRKIKENNAETLLYEVDLLRFARERLLSPQSWWTQLDEWLYLEDFLLHYRNLIEFFGKPKPGDGDLSILRPELVWFDHVPDKAELDSMTRLDLWEKYDLWGWRSRAGWKFHNRHQNPWFSTESGHL